MTKAVFFDRDGVINYEIGNYVYAIDKFKINNGVIEFIQLLQKEAFIIIIITNQGGIAKKLYTRKDVEKLHDHMLQCFKKNNIHIDEIYYCPHHRISERCICRKPDSLMLEKAMARFNIDPTKSYFIGDKETDYEAGLKAGLNAIKIEKNANLMNIVKIKAIINSQEP
jgi:D-glycero-D-manno-heptose 1,7-bisphosphate phosphatase